MNFMFNICLFSFKVDFLCLGSPSLISLSVSMIKFKEFVIKCGISKIWMNFNILVELRGDVRCMFNFRSDLRNMKINEVRIVSMYFIQFFWSESCCVNIVLNVNMFVIKSKRRMLFRVSRSVEIIKSLVVLNFVSVILIKEGFFFLNILLCALNQSISFSLWDLSVKIKFMDFLFNQMFDFMFDVF